jgi:hypothetical protein
LLWDIHSGICGSHSSWHSIIDKVFRHGFYWPIAKDDAMKIVTKCRIASSFRSKPQSMLILFGLLISPDHSQFGESISWAFFPGH